MCPWLNKSTFHLFCSGQKGRAYTLITDKDMEMAGHLVRNLESVNQEVRFYHFKHMGVSSERRSASKAAFRSLQPSTILRWNRRGSALNELVVEAVPRILVLDSDSATSRRLAQHLVLEVVILSFLSNPVDALLCYCEPTTFSAPLADPLKELKPRGATNLTVRDAIRAATSSNEWAMFFLQKFLIGLQLDV